VAFTRGVLLLLVASVAVNLAAGVAVTVRDQPPHPLILRKGVVELTWHGEIHGETH
jgi:hypothetical protein